MWKVRLLYDVELNIQLCIYRVIMRSFVQWLQIFNDQNGIVCKKNKPKQNTHTKLLCRRKFLIIIPCNIASTASHFLL